MTNHNLKHTTLVLERISSASIERVFAGFANPEERASWGRPSETTAFIYDKVDFREGGEDVFRCGDTKAILNIGALRPITNIVPNERIISSKVVESKGRKLLISMSTTTFEPEGTGTSVTVTVQLASLAGEDMLNGAKFGHNVSLDNLVKAIQ